MHTQLDKARHLLTLMDPEHLKTVYTHRAARIVLIKQEEILLRMIREGKYASLACVRIEL